jgi:hypothetical protein
LVALAQLDKPRDEQRGKIVNAKKTVVLESANGKTLTGAGKPRDDDDIEAFGHKDLAVC